MRALALVWVAAILDGCGPRPLPPLAEAPVAVTRESRCHGLGTTFQWQATKVGGDKADEYHRLRWGYNFLYMFGPVGHQDLHKVPRFAKAVFDPNSVALRLIFVDDIGATLLEIKFPNAQVVECTPSRSRITFDFSFGSAEAGSTNERRTVTFTKGPDLTRIQARVQAENSYLFLRRAKQWEYWGDFRSGAG